MEHERPYIRQWYHPKRVSLSFPEGEGKTHQSFKDECDINNIVRTYTNTGIVTHVARLKPQYGDNPESTFFDLAAAKAAVDSAVADGFDMDEYADPEESVEDSEIVAPAASEAAETTENVEKSD